MIDRKDEGEAGMPTLEEMKAELNRLDGQLMNSNPRKFVVQHHEARPGIMCSVMMLEHKQGVFLGYGATEQEADIDALRHCRDRGGIGVMP